MHSAARLWPTALVQAPSQAVRRAVLTTALVIGGVVAGLWLYGLGSGGGFYYRLARAPLAPASAAPYYRESLLHVGLARVLGFSGSIVAFRGFVLAFFWAALAVVTAAAQRRLRPGPALLVWAVMLTHPIAMIVHSWTCHPDALLVLLTALLLLVRGPRVVGLLAALAAWTNLAMASVVAASCALLWFGLREAGARARSLALLLGLAAGAASCKLTLWLAGVQLARDRFAAAAGQDPGVLVRYWTDPGWPVVYSLHFAHLLWLPALVATLRRHHPGAAPALVAAQLLALAATCLAEDTTRVFACLAWGPLLYGLLRALQALERPGVRDEWRLRPLVGVATGVTLLAPRFFAWKGQLHGLDGAHAYLRGLLS